MKVTKTDVAKTLSVALADVKQIDNKQLFVVHNFRQNRTVLVSYKIIVGILFNNTWHLTTAKYSVTTSRQLSQFTRRTDYSVVYVADCVMNYILNNGKLPEETNEQN